MRFFWGGGWKSCVWFQETERQTPTNMIMPPFLLRTIKLLNFFFFFLTFRWLDFGSIVANTLGKKLDLEVSIVLLISFISVGKFGYFTLLNDGLQVKEFWFWDCMGYQKDFSLDPTAMCMKTQNSQNLVFF